MLVDSDNVAIAKRVFLGELTVNVGSVRTSQIVQKAVVENLYYQCVFTADC